MSSAFVSWAWGVRPTCTLPKLNCLRHLSTEEDVSATARRGDVRLHTEKLLYADGQQEPSLSVGPRKPPKICASCKIRDN
jgi:hypothetical protein